MKLLFDQNLSPYLVNRLSDLYPDSNHVRHLELDRASDQEVWNYAKNNEYTIVTKDVDFSERSLLQGFPPRVIWIRRGNCSTRDIEMILRDHSQEIADLSKHEKTGILVLF